MRYLLFLLEVDFNCFLGIVMKLKDLFFFGLYFFMMVFIKEVIFVIYMYRNMWSVNKICLMLFVMILLK